MKVMVEEAGACRKKLHVEVPAERVDEEFGRVVKSFMAGANIPGFRKGKAPRHVIESRYEDGIIEETRDRLLPICYQEAIRQEELTPLAVIEVSEARVARSAPMTFDVTVDVRPDFDLPDYKAIELESELKDVSDEDVQEAIDSIRERQAGFEDSDRDTVEPGDLVQVDYTAELPEGVDSGDDAVPDQLKEAADFWYPTGEQEFLPGMTESLSGAKVDSEVKAQVAFPEAFQVESIAGQTLEYQVQVKGIREKKLPDIDKAFLEQFSVEDEAALNERVREDLGAMAERNERGRLRDEICRQLSEQTTFDLPESLVAQEARRRVQDIVYENMMRGVPREELEKAQENIQEQAGTVAREQLKVKFILLRIATEENLTVEESELAAAIREGAAQAGKKPAEYRKELSESGAEDSLREDLLAAKVLDFLLDQADVKS